MKATVTFDITVPDGISKEHLLEFLNFELQMDCELSDDNPLINNELGCFNPHFLNVGIYPDK